MNHEMLYPAKFAREDKGYSVSFPDFPEAFTCGDTIEEAEEMAADCLAEALAARIADKETIPKPSRGSRLIPVPTWIAAKALLYQAMRDAAISNVALAKKMNVTENVIRQLLDPKRSGSSLLLFDQAFRKLRKPLVLSYPKTMYRAAAIAKKRAKR